MDQGEYYRSLGYQVAGGALEFYYVAMRTHKTTQATQICLCGEISWSNDQHDPVVTMNKINKDRDYDYSRLGPYPHRAEAEKMAIDMSMKIFNVPTKYGIFSVQGPREMNGVASRDPKFF
jgi:hypothetical protein